MVGSQETNEQGAMPNDTEGGRGRRMDRRAREEKILRAALSVFEEKGFASARMEDVAEKVGLSKPALYLYFKDKEDLLRSALLRIAQTSVQMLETAAAGPSDPKEKLSRALDGGYRSMLGDDDHPGFASMMPVVAVTASRFPEMARFFRDQCIQKIDAVLLAIVAEGEESGVFTRSGLSQHAELLMGPMIAFGLRRAAFGALDDNAPYDVDVFKAEHKRMVFAALGAT